MNRFPRPSKSRRRARDGSRQVLVIVVALGAILALGMFTTDELVTAKRQAAAAAAATDDEIYFGSILYRPAGSKPCRQLLFDNQTGQFADNGYVDCEHATYQGTNGTPKQWSVARMRALSSGFYQH